MKYDVIIIGAGAAGLIAMLDLLKEGYRVCMLEAADKAGGRISTVKEKGFKTYIEAGAEFIHGKLPLTLKLLNEAGISYYEVEGKMCGVRNGAWKSDEHNENWDEFISKLKKLKTDTTIFEFLTENFSDNKYMGLRQDVQRFAEGFDLADISRASVLSIKDEWQDIEKPQYRIEGGYGQLIKYLLDQCIEINAMFYFNSCVNKIDYKKKPVAVYTQENKKFEADKLIITASAGILQSGIIQFAPALKEQGIAIQGLGFGAVIKFLLQFKTNFWNKYENEIGFILSDEKVPTWWTQLPIENNLLTGWMGESKAMENVFQPETDLLKIAIESLSSIFKIPVLEINEQLESYKIINWQEHPTTKGGYSFSTLYTKEAKKILSTPVDEAIYFAGEAVSQGESQGTVESALQSGKEVASLMIRHFRKR